MSGDAAHPTVGSDLIRAIHAGDALSLLHGVDLVSVERIAQMRADHGQRFLDRCFTADEQAYCLQSSKRADEHLAARFAAKEAVVKALGTGLRNGIRWTDIEIVRAPSGQPVLALHGAATARAAAMGARAWTVSLSHTDSHAFASVVAVGGGEPDSATRRDTPVNTP